MSEKTLRDEFAMAALTGLLSDSNINSKPEAIVEGAYMYAEYMIRERKGWADKE